MKKLLFAALPFLLILVVFLPSCAKKSAEAPRPVYTVESELDAKENALAVKTDIKFTIPQDGLSAVKLRLFANAYSEGRMPVTAEKKSAAYPQGASYGGAEILSVSSSAGVKEYSVGVEDATVLTVRFPEKKAKGDEISLSIEETVRLATVKHRLGAYGGYYNLSGFYPVLCPFSDGKFRTDDYLPYGDPFLFVTSDVSLTLTVPVGFEAAASAFPLARERQGKKTTYRFALEKARDFAVVASDRFQMAEAEESGVPIRYYYESDKKSSDLLQTAATAVRIFKEAFGDYPYAALTLVSAPFAEAGMEFSGLALLSNELSNAAKKQTAVHEIAHQWWFGKVGFDQYLSPWMDEGLSEYATAYYYKAIGADSAFRTMLADAEEEYSIRFAIKGAEACRLDSALIDLASGYYEIAYCKSLLLFSSLAELNGYDAFNAALRAFADEYAGRVASPENLIDALSRSLEKDLAPFFDVWLGADLPAV